MNCVPSCLPFCFTYHKGFRLRCLTKNKRIPYCLYVPIHPCKARLCGGFSLHSSCCWVTERDTSRVWKRSSDSVTSVSRCCLNSAPLLSSLFHLKAKLSPSRNLTSPRRCCVVFCRSGARYPLLPPHPQLLWPHFPFLHNCVRTTLSSCHSSSPSAPHKKRKTFWRAWRLSEAMLQLEKE